MRNILLLTLAFFAIGCGVKGNPLPPLEEPMISRGKPSFQKATQPLKQIKKNDDDDWKDESDFSEEKKK